MLEHMKMFKPVLSVLLYCVLSIPASAQSRQATDDIIINVANQTAFRRMEIEPKAKGWTSEELEAALKEAVYDQTKIVVQYGHGVFVEYTAPDGHLYMWYPGNTDIVHGEWGVTKVKKKPRVCFKYRNAYHGVTGEFEPKECIDPIQTLSQSFVIERRRGDGFGLASGKIPYRKGKTDIPDWPVP